jgi:hypothetical protein
LVIEAISVGNAGLPGKLDARDNHSQQLRQATRRRASVSLPPPKLEKHDPGQKMAPFRRPNASYSQGDDSPTCGARVFGSLGIGAAWRI